MEAWSLNGSKGIPEFSDWHLGLSLNRLIQVTTIPKTADGMNGVLVANRLDRGKHIGLRHRSILKAGGPMRIPVPLVAVLILLGAGCGLWKSGSGAKVLSIDKSVDQATADRLGALLLQKVPAIRAEQAAWQQRGGAVELILRVEHAPEPDYTGPDKAYHRNYFWMYVGFHGKDGILKQDRYLVHKDLPAAGGGEILRYDDAKDAFLSLSEPTVK